MNFISHIKQNVFIGFGIIFGVLFLATIFSQFLSKTKRQKDYSELISRINSWWVIVILFAFATLSTSSIALVFLCLVSFLAFKEYLSLIPVRSSDRRALFWAYLAIPIQFYLLHIRWYDLFSAFIPIYAFLLIPLRMILIGETKGFLLAISSIHWGLMTTVFCIGHLGALLTLDPERNPVGGSAGLLLFIVAMTELNDVAQYCWGKTFGKHKIVPKISPKKTVEGFVGGLLTTTLVCYFVAPLLTPASGWHALFLGLILGVGGFFGDVVISAIKRDIGVKDSGNWIPGHGGILDRIDSLTFTAPLFFRFIHFFYYKSFGS